MTLLELVKFLRTSILDDSGGFGVQWEDITEDDNATQQLRWSNEELVGYINEAIRQVYRRIQPIQDVSNFKVEAKAGIADYPIDPRIIQIVMIRSESSGKVLNPADLHQYIEYQDFTVTESTPDSYIPNYQSGSIRLFPTPTANETYQMIVYRFPLNSMDWLKPNQSPELRIEYHIPMLNYAAYLAYLKDDANTFDPQRANLFLTYFTNEFSDTSAYAETRKRRSSDRQVKYGGVKQTTFGRLGTNFWSDR